MSFYNAVRQFEENLRLFAKTEPEKYNLYAGLVNLAEGLRNIELKLDEIMQILYRLPNR